MNAGKPLKETIDLTDVLTLIIQEIQARTKLFSFLETEKCTVCVASNRKNSRGGIYGKLVPLYFENGTEEVSFRGKRYRMPVVQRNNIRQKYIIYFYMPKFFDLDAREKLRVIFHELYHINPAFNGDIRRMTKGKAAHGHSRRHFDSHFQKELDQFYAYVETTHYIRFLRLTSRDIFHLFGKVKGRRMKLPRPVTTG